MNNLRNCKNIQSNIFRLALKSEYCSKAFGFLRVYNFSEALKLCMIHKGHIISNITVSGGLCTC